MATRTYLHNIQAGYRILKVDFCNTFNRLNAPSVLDHAPEIYPLVFSAYCKSTSLFFGNHIVESAEEVQQGDPLGTFPAFQSIAIHQLVGIL